MSLLTVAESIATHARTQPHKIGVRDSKRALSYAEWDQRASRLAHALLGLGLVRGDRVALLAFNTIEWLEIYVALARAGLVAVPINFRLVGPEIAYIVQHSEARAFIVQEDLRATVEGIRAELPIDAARYVHFGAGTTPNGWQGYESLIAAAGAEAKSSGFVGNAGSSTGAGGGSSEGTSTGGSAVCIATGVDSARMSCGDFGSVFGGGVFFFGSAGLASPGWRKMSGIVTESDPELVVDVGFADTAKDVAAKTTTSPHQCPRIDHSPMVARRASPFPSRGGY